jgi:DNA replication and repair protein RecF
MHIQSLSLENFRNISKGTLAIPDDCNRIIIQGPNGAGKTNIFESILLLFRGKTHRTLPNTHLIKNNTEQCSVSATLYTDDNLKHRVRCLLNNKTKEHTVNFKNIGTRLSLISQFPLVNYYPDELNCLRESPAMRRKLLDSSMALFTGYINCWRSYNQQLKNRNELLKNKLNIQNIKLIDTYHHQMEKTGNELTSKRKEFINTICESMTNILKEMNFHISDFTLKLIPGYKSTNLAAQLENSITKDIQLRRTTIGPHLADLVFSLKGYPVKINASQGELRLLFIAYKLAVLKYYSEILHETPLFLIDDLSSEIGPTYLERIISIIPKDIQFWMNTVNLDNVSKYVSHNSILFTIDNGLITK